MSAQPIVDLHDPNTSCAPMRLCDVPEVAAIERSIYAAPWTEGNFVDSLHAGYCAWTLRPAAPVHRMVGDPGPALPLIGYFVLMTAVDEAHLLNVSIATAWQRRGHGLFLLRRAVSLAAERQASSLILEVRPSNLRARAVYRRFGFQDHGLRRRYYPASADDQQSREDALVMRLPL
jgi:ribosomal-protein-alanine N-acetyltransferase